ncbi:MAG: beta-galactosidase [Sphingomonas sp.]|uniref:beta-galactosidase n=1 Tax=Sphingomonas sp. TaxID=28214 RepID=UPI0025DB240E|nr:beta-galactosidase [Sphingomonas sp.]MBX9882385.1 beta-galactosidase [Sphingomonas sp.]
MRLGCCYYPEHWPEAWWAEDARRMAALGLSRVRIGEFAWSRIEPEPGRFDWGWLDRAIATLAAEGLGIILGTPTATPPKWLVDQMPDMIALDAQGRPRRFGSRRHYCFSHPGYRAEAERITRALAERYGDHPAIVAWQTDNEYGCHDTAISHSPAAAEGFRAWLGARYGDVAALNAAWGTVFWSMEYRDFAEIDPPNLTVTEPHPAHVMDWRRFSSDQVRAFNAAQVAILRADSPGRDIVHNFMGFFTQFDHHDVSADLDVATWDSYPIGFLDSFWFSREDKLRYARQGHPDIAAFHHDLYRGAGRGRWWVMEQQPGPVNWSAHNPAPLPGMVRLWTLEAAAHGAELTSYFRWRQAPFGQEAHHAGLLRPDSAEDQGAIEARAAAHDLAALGEVGTPQAPVALLFSYPASWAIETQPQGKSFRYLQLAHEWYTALRRLGLDVDIVPPEADLAAYRMIVAPSLPMLDTATADRIAALGVPVLFGPRTGSRTESFQTPPELPPGPLQEHLPLKVVRVESLREGLAEHGDGFAVTRWLEHVESDLAPEEELADGRGIVFGSGQLRYLGAWPDAALLDRLMRRMALEADLKLTPLPADLRVRRTDRWCFAFNYGPEAVPLTPLEFGAPMIGADPLPPAGVAAWPIRGRNG